MNHANETPDPSAAALHPATLQAFVLDQLEPAAREAVEARLLADEAVFAQAREVEDDLLDGYVQGTLDAATRARVDETLLATPDGHARLAVAQGLHQRRLRPRHAPPTRWRWALAALLLVTMGAGWWAARLGNPVHDVPGPHGGQVVALTIGLGVRGAEAPSLAIPTSATRVRLDVDLEGTPEIPFYSATVRDANETAVWSNNQMEAHTESWGRYLVVEIPAETLMPGTYTVTLVPRGNDDPAATIGHFPFRIDPAAP